jgi:hypothetical protein
MTALDTAMLIAVTFAVPALIWPLILAMTASAVRIIFTARTLCFVLTG